MEFSTEAGLSHREATSECLDPVRMEECGLRGGDFRAGPEEFCIVRQLDPTARSDFGGNPVLLEQVCHLRRNEPGRSSGDDGRDWGDRPGADECGAGVPPVMH